MGGHPGAEGFGAGLVGAQPVGRSVDADDDASVQQPVEHGGGDDRVAERGGPRGDADVGGDGGGGAVGVAGVDHLEQRGGGLGGQRQVAQFIDQQELGACVEAHHGGPAAL